MRKLLLTSAITSVAILLLSSCSSDREAPDATDAQPSEVLLTISSGKTGSPAARSNGATLPAGSATDEGKLNQVSVGLFSAGGSLVSFYAGAYTGGSITISTSTVATRLFVAANAPEDAFKGKSTLEEFEKVNQDLSLTTSATGSSADATATTANSQTSTSLPMASEVLPLTWDKTTATAKASVDAKLYRRVARVALTALDYTNFSGAYAGSTFTPEEVFMYNAANTLTDWSAGTAVGNVSGEYASDSQTNYLGSGAITSFSPPYYFYVFPHGTATPTRLVIKGRLKTADGTETTTYYPITVYHKDANTTLASGGTDSQIDANTTYAITAKINGVGADRVTDDITPATITANVSIGTMTDVTINDNF